jgi:leucine dehydrogenase
MTAYGCLIGLRQCCEEAFGSDDLAGRRIAIQGIGAVGGRLAELCQVSGMRVFVCDIDAVRVRRFAHERHVEALSGPDAALTHPCDILSPCARGGILNARTIPRLQCRIVAGAANNQLETPADARRLQQRGIVYAPDYVINAGGIINIACEFTPEGYSVVAARRRTEQIAPTLAEVFRIAREQNISTATAADRLAEERLAEGRGVGSTFVWDSEVD